MDEVFALFRSAEGLAGPAARARLAALGPGLTVGGSVATGATGDVAVEASHADREEGAWLAKEGFAALPDVAPDDTCRRLVEAIERLTTAGLPAMFVYLFDEPWTLGERVRARVSAMLGQRYDVIEDVWAWRIAPGSGRGWPPHRGVAQPLLAREAPQLINAWVALSDVEPERACMHFVPLDEDPSYPHALASLDAPLTAVRAAPLRAGSALAWNANVLHWGGPCAPRAIGPRVSCSFSLARADALAELGFPRAEDAATDLRARLDAVARQIEIYGKGQQDVSAAVRAWAQANVLMKAAITNRSG